VDRSTELQSVRELRNIAILGDVSARLTLCRLYAAGKYGGCDRQQAVSYIREFIQSSAVLDVRAVYGGKELTHSMRCVHYSSPFVNISKLWKAQNVSACITMYITTTKSVQSFS